jgi:hypothetical protein
MMGKIGRVYRERGLKGFFLMGGSWLVREMGASPLDPPKKKMQKLRRTFRNWVNLTTSMMEKAEIGPITISIINEDMFVRAENGLDFVYVPNHGIRHLEFNGTNDRLQIKSYSFIRSSLLRSSTFQLLLSG